MIKSKNKLPSQVLVKKIRHKLILSQTDFAKALKITQSSICQYENGTRIPAYPIIKKIITLAKANGIDCSADDFFS